MLTNLDLVVYRVRYYCINVLNGLKHFMTKFRLNMYLNILRSFKSKFNFEPFFQIVTNESFSRVAYQTECTRIMNMVFQRKNMIMEKSSFSSAFNI